MHLLFRMTGNILKQSSGKRLEQTLVVLELSQKAAELYAKKEPEQKRLIITKLFREITFDGDSLSVQYTDFARLISEKVRETHKILGGVK